MIFFCLYCYHLTNKVAYISANTRRHSVVSKAAAVESRHKITTEPVYDDGAEASLPGTW